MPGPLICGRTAVNRKRLVASIFAKAKKYRNFTRTIDDRETAQRILELTEELKVRGACFGETRRRSHPNTRPGNLGRKWPTLRERSGVLVSGRTGISRSRGSRNTRRRRYLINISYLFSNERRPPAAEPDSGRESKMLRFSWNFKLPKMLRCTSFEDQRFSDE
jgi:hypothetical protein